MLLPRDQALGRASSDAISLFGAEDTEAGPLRLLVEKDFAYINPGAVWQEDHLSAIDRAVVRDQHGHAPRPSSTEAMRSPHRRHPPAPLARATLPCRRRLPALLEALEHGGVGVVDPPRDVDALPRAWSGGFTRAAIGAAAAGPPRTKSLASGGALARGAGRGARPRARTFW